MITRIVFIAATAIVLSASLAGAQGQQQKQVVISKAVMKSMVANKPKSKTQLGAKAGIVKRKNVVASKPLNVAPTSVHGIPKKN
jgi:hypothetical protein